MNKNELTIHAIRFRRAIEKAKAQGKFVPQGRKVEIMNQFPYDCCDDTADLFIHYLYDQFGIDSIKIIGVYHDDKMNCDCCHAWQITCGWHIDLTGDQFDKDSSILIKTHPIYVGRMDDFHRQFKIQVKEHSCGIPCLSETAHERMNGLYNIIKDTMNKLD